MKGDGNYQLLFTGQTATSADTAHLLTGTYNGLSDLNAADVVYFQLHAATNDLVVHQTLAASVQTGMSIQADQSFYVDIPPIKVSRAQNYHIRNATNGSNGTMSFNVWTRIS